jgi:potassium efflux system protein
VNWSLSNPTLRVIIPVGVAYGTDTKLVRETLSKVADRSKRVLKQPAPQIWFMDFGDSALGFQLRVFIAGIEDYLPVQDDLHHEIAAAFREKHIEIAFPQRDLHIRSIAPALTVKGESVPVELEQQ